VGQTWKLGSRRCSGLGIHQTRSPIHSISADHRGADRVDVVGLPNGHPSGTAASSARMPTAASVSRPIAVMADLSGSAPNVLFEVGFAFALGKPCVLVCSTPLNELPFDIRNQKTISYAKGQTYLLKEDLIPALRAIP
jgi:hypothetical protein